MSLGLRRRPSCDEVGEEVPSCRCRSVSPPENCVDGEGEQHGQQDAEQDVSRLEVHGTSMSVKGSAASPQAATWGLIQGLRRRATQTPRPRPRPSATSARPATAAWRRSWCPAASCTSRGPWARCPCCPASRAARPGRWRTVRSWPARWSSLAAAASQLVGDEVESPMTTRRGVPSPRLPPMAACGSFGPCRRSDTATPTGRVARSLLSSSAWSFSMQFFSTTVGGRRSLSAKTGALPRKSACGQQQLRRLVTGASFLSAFPSPPRTNGAHVVHGDEDSRTGWPAGCAPSNWGWASHRPAPAADRVGRR